MCPPSLEKLHKNILKTPNYSKKIIQPLTSTRRLIRSQTSCNRFGAEQPLNYVLIHDEVRSKAQHVAVALLVRPPAQTESHEEKP